MFRVHVDRSKLDLKRIRRNLESARVNIVNDAADMVVRDIQSGVRSRTDINNKPFQRLQLTTAKRKQRKGSPHPTRPLHDTGHMAFGPYVSKRATQSDPEATIIPPKTHPSLEGTEYSGTDLARWHQEGAGNLPQREWFGVSERVLPRIRRIKRKHVRNALRRGI